MIKIKQAVVVEGKYDKMRLSALIDAPIIETNGFRVFRDKEKVSLIKKLAQTRGLLILTDSDGAGFVIRNYLKSLVPPETIKKRLYSSYTRERKEKAVPLQGRDARRRGHGRADAFKGHPAKRRGMRRRGSNAHSLYYA